MGNYNIFERLENPRRGRQARNFTTNVPKILDLKSSSEQIFSKKSLGAPAILSDYQLCLSKIELYICAFSNGLNLLK